MTGEDFWFFFKNVILCKCVSAFLLYVYKNLLHLQSRRHLCTVRHFR
ncbi:hypothetical protein HMPREF1546_01581 [Oscillibacter sp. KLE 1745]|nr:hypothetical protein HMPREF1546_01581 [Oscillibacter sp. KLE 1745]